MRSEAIDRDVGNCKISQNVAIKIYFLEAMYLKVYLSTSYTSQELGKETLSGDSLESVIEFIK